MDISKNMSQDIAKKIIGNKEYAIQFLIRLNELKTSENISSLKKIVLKYSTNELWSKIVEEWDYKLAIQIVRNIFRSTKKYLSGKEASETMQILISEWNDLNLGKIEWPFSQGAFDEFVQRINSEESNGYIKDDKVKSAAVKYRRIKEINTYRNDFIETLIFEKNESILPTLNHRRGVDFYIDGISFDQKVAKSPTNEFKKHFKDNWKQVAIENPQIVAEYLYKYQDEGRFGADSRLLVVYLDEDVSVKRIKELLDSFDISRPYEVNFSYKHKIQGQKTYKVTCFIILLYNE